MFTKIKSKSGNFLLVCLLIVGSRLSSQNNLVVFSENGERFQLLINGVKQNANFESNVKVQNLIHPQYKAKIIFEEKAKGVVDWTVYLMDGGETVNNHEFVYNVKMTKGGEFKVRPMSVVAISEAQSDPSQTVVNFSTSETPTLQNNQNSSTTIETNVNTSGNQSGSTSNNGNSTGIDINMNGLGVNMGVSINVNENSGTVNQSTSTHTTNTTSTTNQTSTTISNNSTTASGQNPNNSSSLCARPMNEGDFLSAKKSIETKSFEESKLKVAKQIADANCLSCDQIKQVMQLFSFEDSKLNFAKHSYTRCSDTKNYFKLNDAFSFESSIDDLDTYIKSVK